MPVEAGVIGSFARIHTESSEVVDRIEKRIDELWQSETADEVITLVRGLGLEFPGLQFGVAADHDGERTLWTNVRNELEHFVIIDSLSRTAAARNVSPWAIASR
jgi:hypothetical protein